VIFKRAEDARVENQWKRDEEKTALSFPCKTGPSPALWADLQREITHERPATRLANVSFPRFLP